MYALHELATTGLLGKAFSRMIVILLKVFVYSNWVVLVTDEEG